MHFNPFAHATVVLAHVPVPLHVGRISLLPSALQVELPHSLPAGACLHAPAPLHLPIKPHAVLSAVQLSTSSAPSATFAQVPAVFLQLSQVPHAGLSQQVPSTHVKPAAHSVVAEQPEPLGFRPHEKLDPNATQFTPALQSADWVSGVHVDLHVALEELQRKSPHDCELPIKHMPWPLQKPALLSSLPPAGHMATVHIVLGLHRLQPPAPSHWPFVPHDVAGEDAQSPAKSALPAATFEQVPAEPERLHARHVPLHSVSQHTPSMQKVLAQSAAAVQVAPNPLVPQRPSTHIFPATHSVVSWHESMHAVPAALHVYGAHERLVPAMQIPVPEQ